MSVVKRAITNILVYEGHALAEHPGPYAENVMKQFKMFEIANEYRAEYERPLWKVIKVAGEKLISTLNECTFKNTLLVIPAGQSSHLDAAFTKEQLSFIKETFLRSGGRLYGTCGASYMMSKERIYYGLHAHNPTEPQLSVKKSVLPLYEGTAKGPLCPFPGAKYKVGFYSDAVTVKSEVTKQNCTIYLSGGGSFLPNHQSGQETKVLVKYLEEELLRLGKAEKECQVLANATVLTRVGFGAALLSMFHPYYGPSDIDVDAYQKAFPDSGTDWEFVRDHLSPLEERIRFFLESMIFPLEDLEEL